MYSAEPGISASAAIAAEVSSADPGWAVVTHPLSKATDVAAQLSVLTGPTADPAR
jgi:hypothetical protein